MYFSPTERLALLIDGSELRATAGGMGLDVDFSALLKLFQRLGKLVRANFYFVDRDEDEESLRPLTDWLDYNGYTTVPCAGRDDGDAVGRRRNKNFLNVRLAVDALEMAPEIDHVVLFSGDNVLGPVVDALKWRGRRVSVVSTLHLRPPMIADDLRRRADQFIDIADIAEHIIRKPATLVRRQPQAQRPREEPKPRSDETRQRTKVVSKTAESASGIV